MKRIILMLICTILMMNTITVSYAEETPSDALDNSAELEEAQENGIPTEAIVTELKEKADALYADEKWEEAAEAYSEAAKKAEFLADIMIQCGKPYYSGGDDYEDIPSEIYEELLDLENKSNSLIRIRNTCYVYQGVCYNKLGDSELALETLYLALDSIDYSESDNWTTAAKELMELIQYVPDEAIITKRENRLAEEKAQEEERLAEEEMLSYEGKPYSEFEARYGKADDSCIFSTLETIAYYYDGVDVEANISTNIIESVLIYGSSIRELANKGGEKSQSDDEADSSSEMPENNVPTEEDLNASIGKPYSDFENKFGAADSKQSDQSKTTYKYDWFVIRTIIDEDNVEIIDNWLFR